MTVISLLTQRVRAGLQIQTSAQLAINSTLQPRLCYVTVIFALPVIMAPSALTSSPSGTWILPDHLASWAAVAQEDSGLEAPWTSHEVRSLNSLRKQNQTREACAWRRTGLSEPQARTVLPGIFESSSTPLFLGCP